jgi:heme A synthase
MQRRFAIYAWAVVAYNLTVIVWGAFVRATGSGAGCGAHWPLCNGQVVPRAPRLETLIELAHRLSSGMAGLLVIGLLAGALRAFPRGHIARRGAWIALGLMLLEGALGAGLVLLGLVDDNSSPARAVAMGVHLINTLLLIGALTLTAWWGAGGAAPRLRGQGLVAWLLMAGVAGMLALGASGAVTALGDTLFPAGSLREGFAQDRDPTAHILLRLRVWHPSLAIGLGVYLLAAGRLVSRRRPSAAAQAAAGALALLFLAQIGLGALNLVLLAPLALQLAHLLLADLVWIALTLLCATALAEPAAQPVAQTAALAPAR